MKNEIALDSSLAATPEHRLMALIALTTQALPDGRLTQSVVGVVSAAEETATRFDELDADPVRLEAYLRRGMHPPLVQATRMTFWKQMANLASSWVAPARLAYVAAFGAAVIAAFITLWHAKEPDSLSRNIAASYREVEWSMSNEALVLPWERGAQALGFAPSVGNDTPAGREFAHGLLRGRSRLTEARVVDLPETTTEYGALGEWNVLLWGASQSYARVPVEFWREQVELMRRFEQASYAAEDQVSIAEHIDRIRPLLVELGGNSGSARVARSLADELTRFREAFAPHSSSELGLPP